MAAAHTAGSKWWSKDTVAVVTGSNRGLGHEILRQLAKVGMTTVLTDFVDLSTLEATAERLKTELGLQSRIVCHHLDVRSDESVKEFAGWLKKEFGGIDILVNNAGVQKKLATYEHAKDVLDTNFWGTKKVTEALLPLMRSSSPGGARIIIVTSRLGSYKRLKSGFAKEKFENVELLTPDILDQIGNKYLEDVKAGRRIEEGWVDFWPMYSESKMLLSAYTLVLSKSQLSDGQNGSIFVAGVTPGPTLTAMSQMGEESKTWIDAVGSSILKKVEDGADTPVWLCLLPKEGYPHGKLLCDRAEYSFDKNYDTPSAN